MRAAAVCVSLLVSFDVVCISSSVNTLIDKCKFITCTEYTYVAYQLQGRMEGGCKGDMPPPPPEIPMLEKFLVFLVNTLLQLLSALYIFSFCGLRPRPYRGSARGPHLTPVLSPSEANSWLLP